jgi:hypothetical protein
MCSFTAQERVSVVPIVSSGLHPSLCHEQIPAGAGEMPIRRQAETQSVDSGNTLCNLTVYCRKSTRTHDAFRPDRISRRLSQRVCLVETNRHTVVSER